LVSSGVADEFLDACALTGSEGHTTVQVEAVYLRAQQARALDAVRGGREMASQRAPKFDDAPTSRGAKRNTLGD
jgi:hypothetical protein